MIQLVVSASVVEHAPFTVNNLCVLALDKVWCPPLEVYESLVLTHKGAMDLC